MSLENRLTRCYYMQITFSIPEVLCGKNLKIKVRINQNLNPFSISAIYFLNIIVNELCNASR